MANVQPASYALLNCERIKQMITTIFNDPIVLSENLDRKIEIKNTENKLVIQNIFCCVSSANYRFIIVNFKILFQTCYFRNKKWH